MSKPKRPTQVTEPVLTVKSKDGKNTYRLWVLDVGQWCQISPARCHYYRAGNTASLIYESNTIKSGGNHYTEENYIDNKETWDWVAQLMQMGMNHSND